MKYVILIAAILLPACQAHTVSGDGYTIVSVVLFESDAPEYFTDNGYCVIGTDIVRTHDGPGDLPQFGAIGRALHDCITGAAPHGKEYATPWFEQTFKVRLDGECPSVEGFTYYGCWTPDWHDPMEKIDINLDGICKGCGNDIEAWPQKQYEHYFRVVGHEFGHIIYGGFH